MEGFFDRVDVLANHYGMTRSNLCDSAGINYMSFYRARKDANPKRIVIHFLLHFKEVNANWILFGEGNMLKENTKDISLEIIQKEIDLLKEDVSIIKKAITK